MNTLTSEKLKTLLTMVGNRKEVDPETRRVFNRLMAQAVSLGFGNVIDWVRGRREGIGRAGDWGTMTPEQRREMLNARMENGGDDEPETNDQKEQKNAPEDP